MKGETYEKDRERRRSEDRDHGADGIAASAQNGYRLDPGASTAIPLTALELSVVADDADTDVRVLLLDEY